MAIKTILLFTLCFCFEYVDSRHVYKGISNCEENLPNGIPPPLPARRSSKCQRLPPGDTAIQKRDSVTEDTASEEKKEDAGFFGYLKNIGQKIANFAGFGEATEAPTEETTLTMTPPPQKRQLHAFHEKRQTWERKRGDSDRQLGHRRPNTFGQNRPEIKNHIFGKAFEDLRGKIPDGRHGSLDRYYDPKNGNSFRPAYRNVFMLKKRKLPGKVYKNAKRGDENDDDYYDLPTPSDNYAYEYYYDYGDQDEDVGEKENVPENIWKSRKIPAHRKKAIMQKTSKREVPSHSKYSNAKYENEMEEKA